MKTNTKLSTLATLIALLVTVVPAQAQKGGKKGGGNEPPLQDAGALTLAENIGDAVVSDGAAYADEDLGEGTGVVGIVADFITPMVTTPGYRTVSIMMGTCIAGGCEDPFDGALAGTADATGVALQAFTPRRADGSTNAPNPGETLVSLSDNIGDGFLVVRFSANGEEFLLTWYGAGQITATGYDDTNDGMTDRVDYSAAAGASVLVERLVLTGKGKKKTPSWTAVGEYTDMPFSFSYRALGYEREGINGPTSPYHEFPAAP